MTGQCTFPGWDWECLLHWKQFYKLAAAGLLMICIEWWSFEIGTFLAGEERNQPRVSISVNGASALGLDLTTQNSPTPLQISFQEFWEQLNLELSP